MRKNALAGKTVRELARVSDTMRRAHEMSNRKKPKNLGWVKPFFDAASSWWGRPRIRQSDFVRLERFRRMTGAMSGRILELGAGGGTTAAVMAEAGYHVTAVELSSVRAEFIRQLVKERNIERLQVAEGDFYDLDFDGRFDAVTCWNGFGVGSDEDQRQLLRRVRQELLADGGCMVLDVMSPFRWARIAGRQSEETHSIPLVNASDFDPVESRYFDTWWPTGHEDQAITQSARCYAPSDFLLLVEGTGFTVARMEVAKSEIDAAKLADSSHPLWDAWEYTAMLEIEA
jgi:SAM-dependent methyltransferase